MQEHPVVAAARRAGIVGQGGAGFPTHVKLGAPAEIVIANGCECEPLLSTDVCIMERKTGALLAGLTAAMRATGAARGILAVKRKHTRLVKLLRESLKGTAIELLLLENFYPAGDEQVLIYEATGRSVPPLGLPKAVGCLVSNVGTLVSLAEALEDQPVTSRTVTVAGEVARPSVFTVPLGTPASDCLAHAGGSRVPDPVMILGGPVMGAVLDTPEAMAGAVVTKTLGGIILVPRGHYLHRAAVQRPEVMRRRAAAACIQCRYCTDLCPRFLIGHPFETHRVMRAFGTGLEMTAEAARQALLCCGCGICEHVACPMQLSPAAINAHVKRRFQAEGLGYEAGRDIQPANLEWNALRKIPVPRLAARIGILPYMEQHPAFGQGPEPKLVRIPLRQHIGGPAVAVVSPGDRVMPGDVLARMPEGALGAHVHASIAGTVESIDDAVSIRGA